MDILKQAIKDRLEECMINPKGYCDSIIELEWVLEQIKDYERRWEDDGK